MTIALAPQTEARLKAEASRRGVDPAVLANELIERALPSAIPRLGEPDLATIALLEQWEREDHTDDPEEIARRQREFEEFKEAMNRNRLEMEGPQSRKIYP